MQPREDANSGGAQAGTVPRGIPVFSLRGVFSPLVTIPIAIVFLTMLFAPEDV
jgi:hypothetical protein